MACPNQHATSKDLQLNGLTHHQYVRPNVPSPRGGGDIKWRAYMVHATGNFVTCGVRFHATYDASLNACNHPPLSLALLRAHRYEKPRCASASLQISLSTPLSFPPQSPPSPSSVSGSTYHHGEMHRVCGWSSSTRKTSLARCSPVDVDPGGTHPRSPQHSVNCQFSSNWMENIIHIMWRPLDYINKV